MLSIASDAFPVPVLGSASGFCGVPSLADFVESGMNIRDLLEKELDMRQDAYMKLLFEKFAEHKIVPEERVHFFLSDDGNLIIESQQDADVEKIYSLISSTPDLQNKFKELAQLSVMSHGLGLFCDVWNGIEDGQLLDCVPLSRFHMFFKGTLSHFYVK